MWRTITIDGKTYRTDGERVEVIVRQHRRRTRAGSCEVRQFCRWLKRGKTHRDVIRLTRERL